MRSVFCLIRMRAAVLRNRLLDLHRDAVAKAVVVAFGLALVTGVAYVTALWSFRFIEGVPAIGPPLNERLLSLFFLILLVMVSLSTAVIVYATLFLAAETEFLLGMPASPRLVFSVKVSESVAYSAWASMVLGLPVLAAFGRARSAPAPFYLEAAAVLLLFLVFCGFLGGACMLLLLEIVRRWTWRRFAAAVAVLVLAPAWVFLRSFDFGGLDGEQNLLVLDRFTAGISALRSPFFPGAWATASVVAGAAGDHREALFQGALLLANTLIFLPAFGAYGLLRYGRRWLLARDPAPASLRAGSPPRAGKGPGSRIPSGPFAALAWKDAVTFARDPAQVSQFLLFLLLLAIYVVSLLRIPHDIFGEVWQRVIYFANLAAVCLILSSFSSRFLYPLLSLEGRRIWVVGLAPVEREFLVAQKAAMGRALLGGLGAAAGAASSSFLGFRGWPVAGAAWTALLAGWCLASLAAGLGGAYPSLSEDNPARIAVGLGGTLNFFLSAAAILIILALEGLPFVVHGLSPPPWAVLTGHAAALVFGLGISAYALRLGRRALRAMEF